LTSKLKSPAARALLLAIAACAAFNAASANPSTATTRTIYLVRHGAYNFNSGATSEVGPGLTALGIAQARLIAARLRATPVHFDSITSSALTRAKETAAVIHEMLTDVPLQQSVDLNECTPPGWTERKGETASDETACAKVLDSVFAERFAPVTAANRNELVVAHGNVIRYLVTKALGVDTRAWLGFSIANASLTVIRVHPNGIMTVIAVGDIGHIPPNLQSWGTAADPQLVAGARANRKQLTPK
jgi:serine/threonine-protein phosphatase PGAM5